VCCLQKFLSQSVALEVASEETIGYALDSGQSDAVYAQGGSRIRVKTRYKIVDIFTGRIATNLSKVPAS
jgi:hypothetical protein